MKALTKANNRLITLKRRSKVTPKERNEKLDKILKKLEEEPTPLPTPPPPPEVKNPFTDEDVASIHESLSKLPSLVGGYSEESVKRVH